MAAAWTETPRLTRHMRRRADNMECVYLIAGSIPARHW
jgi:hypothetical protein